MENRSNAEFKGPTMMINWQADEAIATIISSVAIVAGAIFVVIQLRQAARDRYFTITANLFEIWQSSQFQDDQLFLLHKLNAVSWDEFVANGRGERAERALHRVAGFYDRVGNRGLAADRADRPRGSAARERLPLPEFRGGAAELPRVLCARGG
jgi:hypothetical protein